MLELTRDIIRLNESEKEQIKCKVCGFKFAKGLAIEQLTSSGKKHFCPKCNSELKSINNLNS